ncbi:MAG: hypothetical protein JWM86_2716 [Thermoleophilia bacterium]|nr:hypothetical protein [Thermoleophilia bacterium]
MLHRSIATCTAFLTFVMVLASAPAATSETVAEAVSSRVATSHVAPARGVRAVAPGVVRRATVVVSPDELPARMPASFDLGDWGYRMAQRERATFAASIAASPRVVRAAVGTIAPLTTVSVLATTSCGAGVSACATGTVSTTGTVTSATYRLEFTASQFNRSRSSRFLILHEVGHLVDYDQISAEEMRAFEQAFRASPRWRACFRHAGACLGIDEVFADQFALYATGERQSMTTYAVPRLMSAASFERLLSSSVGDAAASQVAPI